MLMVSKSGEVMEYLNTRPYDQIPDGEYILVRQYQWDTSEKRFVPIIRKFFNGSLQKLDDSAFINPNNYFPMEEENMSVSTSLIKAANEKGVAGLKEAMAVRTRKILERAVRVAESKNEFVAIGPLQEVLKQFGSVTKEATLGPKESKELVISRDAGKVTDAVWNAILNKAQKIGDIAKLDSDKKATLRVRKTEVEAFHKAVSSIAGMTANLTKEPA